MTRFNRPSARPAVHGPVQTTGERLVTHEGAPAYARDEKSDLVLMALGSMYGATTLYENGKARESRFAELVRAVAAVDLPWLVAFTHWLRTEGDMRTASLVAAGETARVMIKQEVPGARKVVSSVLQRPDEPGEFLAYWTGEYGRRLPMAVKRGVGDAAIRLYSERSLLKYDTGSHGFRFGDVLELTHPGDTKGSAQHLDGPWQHALFKYAIDRRHNRLGPVPPLLGVLARNEALRTDVKNGTPGLLLDAETVRSAGMTWEDVLSLGGQHGLDKQALWEAMIPSMGYMALLRNLRNFDDAGVPDALATQVAQKLMAESEVARSRQLPFRFFSAYINTHSLRWAQALEAATGFSCANVPAVQGTTQVYVDLSGSMNSTVSDRSGISYRQVGALFAAILAQRGQSVEVIPFGTGNRNLGVLRPGSVLKTTERILATDVGGWGTETFKAVTENYHGADNVFIFTDEQSWGPGRYNYAHYRGDLTKAVPAATKLFAFNLAGHAPSSLDLDVPNRFAVGGFSDRLFTLVDVLLKGRDAGWPWER